MSPETTSINDMIVNTDASVCFTVTGLEEELVWFCGSNLEIEPLQRVVS